ncbi:hypothetical protein EV715DRAFT_292652 [Schizophyllum commune]
MPNSTKSHITSTRAWTGASYCATAENSMISMRYKLAEEGGGRSQREIQQRSGPRASLEDAGVGKPDEVHDTLDGPDNSASPQPSFESEDDQDEGGDGEEPGAEEDEEFADDFTPYDKYEDAPVGMNDLATFVSTLGPSSGTQRKPDAYDDSAPLRAPPKAAHLTRAHKGRIEECAPCTTPGALTYMPYARDSLTAHIDSENGLDDFFPSLALEVSSVLQSLKQAAKVLGPPSLERLHREAAYEQTKEEVNRWTDTKKRLRKADHLSLPAQRFTRD